MNPSAPALREGPRPFVPRLRWTWWLGNPRYFTFMMRELSSVWIAAFLVLYLLQLRALASGPEAYEALLVCLGRPGWIAFHAIALCFALLHSLTWFNLTAKIQVVRLRGRVVDRRLVAAANVLAWLVVSGGVFLFWSRG